MDDMQDFDQVALDKAKYLFWVCDCEKKGFILKSDMKRLKNDLPDLTPAHLDEVFDSLDRDGNGRLTVEEFVHGFAAFLGLQMPDVSPRAEPGNLYDELSVIEGSRREHDNAVSVEQFESFIEKIGGEDTFHDQTAIKALWAKLRKDQPQLLNNFEEFLEQVGSEIQKKTNDFTSLEKILEQRISSRDDARVQHLYEEMEAQIRAEKERVLTEERKKAEKLREELERKLEEKDQVMQELAQRHAEMEAKFENLTDGRAQTEHEKEELQREREAFLNQKDIMEQELDLARRAIEAQKEQLEQVKRRTKEERRERAKAAFKVTEGIACEREDLVKQLDHLRQVNKKLIDERDEIRSLQEPAYPPPIRPLGTAQQTSPKHSRSAGSATRALQQRGEYLGDDTRYGGLAARIHKMSVSGRAVLEEDEDENGFGDVEADDDEYDGEQLPKCSRNHHHHDFIPLQTSLMSELGEALRSNGSVDGNGERVGPLGGNEKAVLANGQMQSYEQQSVTPDRIFKIVFLGDSGVGKTCFVHRFCHDRFIPTFSATIGVDFQVRSLSVEGRLIALQLWDTAGQERFRSITKQYFRKADGVVLMYDVTSELSFLNLRNWLQSVREGVEDDCVLCLIGNKVDLCDNEDSRVLKYKDGMKVADQSGALFFETSAQTGAGVLNSMQALAMLLREREDKHLEKVLHLEMEVQEKKRGCCSGKKN